MASSEPVLVVEDNAAARRVLAALLRAEGYAVATAADGGEALELLRRGGPPLAVLLDLSMPGVDGWQFCRRYRPATRQAAPVVLLSSEPDLAGTAASLGAAAFLPKPVQVPRLLEVLLRLEETRTRGLLVD